MAETVKTNIRKRRPPSHLREEYNEDNFQPPKTYYSTRGEKSQTDNDPSSMLTIARLLSKFLCSANKKLHEDKINRMEDQTPQVSHIAKAEISRPSRSQKLLNSQKYNVGSKIDLSYSEKVLLNNLSSQKYQDKSIRTDNQVGSSTKRKQIKSHSHPPEIPKSIIMDNNFMNVDSMSKMSHEQFYRLIPKGINQNVIKQQLKASNFPQNIIGASKLIQGQPKKPLSSNQFKQDTKLFKRASFHVGIAYNIHIENIKQRNSNFSHQQLDPTYVSKRLRNSNFEMMKKQNEESERLKRQEAILRQRMEEEAALKILQQSRFIQNQIQQKAQNNKKINFGQKSENLKVSVEKNKGNRQLLKVQSSQHQAVSQQKQERAQKELKQQEMNESNFEIHQNQECEGRENNNQQEREKRMEGGIEK